MHIEISNKEEYFNYVIKGLNRFNRENGKTEFFKNMGEEDPLKPEDCIGCYAIENDEIIGGVVFYQEFNWMFVERTYIDSNNRGKGIGSKIFKELEKYCKENHLVGIRLSTWDFQAKSFYEKIGFNLIYQIKDCPIGNVDYGFIKYIES